MKTRTRHSLRYALAAIAAVLALVASACGDTEETTTTTTTAPPETTTTMAATTTTGGGETTTTTTMAETTTTTEAPPEAVTLNVGMGNLAPSGVPWTGAGSPGQYIWSNIFDALTFIEADGSVGPALATSWEAVDETTWVFELRDGVTFQNGEPLDAAAVEATFALLLSEDGRATYSASVNNYGFVESVTATGPMTVELTTSAPNPLTPNAISIAYIAPPAYWAEVGAEGFATAPIGTGPFMAETFNDQEVRLVAWDDSWRNDPQIDELNFLNLNNQATRTQALQSGQIDIAQSVSPDSIQTLQDDGFDIYSSSRGSVMSLALITVNGGPLANVDVRRAMNYAVDKESIVDVLLNGLPNQGVWPTPGINGYDPSRDPYPYDPEMAATLLDQAGFGDGFDIVAEVTVGAFPGDAAVYEAMAGFLSDVGINVELRQIDFAGEWLPKFLGTDGAFWDGDAFGLSWNSAPLIDGIRPFNFFSCTWGNTFYCDEDAVPLITAVNTEFDPAARNNALTELLDYTRENPPALWLVEIVDLWGLDSGVGGFSSNAFNIKFEDVTVSG